MSPARPNVRSNACRTSPDELSADETALTIASSRSAPRVPWSEAVSWLDLGDHRQAHRSASGALVHQRVQRVAHLADQVAQIRLAPFGAAHGRGHPFSGLVEELLGRLVRIDLQEAARGEVRP